MDIWIWVDVIVKSVSFLADFVGLVASGIAVYLFFCKKDTLRSVFRLLLNYTFQLTVTELRSKLDSLDGIKITDDAKKQEAIHVLSKIYGQILENGKIKSRCDGFLNSMEEHINLPDSFTESKKLILINRIKEILRNMDLQNYNDLPGR